MDILVAIFAIAWAVNGLESVSNDYGYGWGQLPVRITAGIAMGLALVFG